MTTAELETMAMIRGSVASASVCSLLLTVAAILYAGRIGKRYENGSQKINILMEAARPWRILSMLNLIALIALSTTYLLWFLFAGPRPFLEPPYINNLFVASFYISLIHIAFPSVVLISYGMRLRRERGQPLLCWRRR